MALPDESKDSGPKLAESRTGLHSLNVETPVASLVKDDITPADLHYVRNHGAVPQLAWETHSIELGAPQAAAVHVTMDQLESKYPAVVLEVTMACDGNRRQELNEIRHSNGFDWGPAVVGTAQWKGVLLRDLLQAHFSEEILRQNNFVLFEGADELPEGHYGTSIPLATALDPMRDALIAYGMNGARLPPNHGFPVRTILPGCVGGRTVKWLRRVLLSPHESDNWYHLHGNRELPPNVTNAAMATKLWGQPETTLYDQTLNSVVLSPAHSETIEITDIRSSIAVAGYAYDGCGRRITRVEVSLDVGTTWLECDVLYPAEYQPRHQLRYWVMCKWRISLPLWQLASAHELVVRAWNDAFHTQPEQPTWNLLGMMNNAWYRVHLVRTCAEKLQCSHPVRTSLQQPKGWLERPPITYEEERIPDKAFSWAEIQKHRQRDDCWVVINDKVYDLTDFMSQHPAGAAPIMAHAGTDVTALFAAIHSYDAHVLKASYVIGHLAKVVADKHFSERPKQPLLTLDGHPIALSPQKWVPVTLAGKDILTHDTRRFTFALPTKDSRMWLPWGNHVNLAITVDERRMVVRPYSPVRPVLAEEDDGTFQLIIKIYFPTESKPGGEMTTMLEALKIGDKVEVKGPLGLVMYTGAGIFQVAGHYFHCNNVNFVVGGTGITPALAITRAILGAKDPEKRSHVKVSIVFANKTMDDILCQDELQDMQKSFPDRLRVWHVLSRVSPAAPNAAPNAIVEFSTGYITEDILRAHCFPPAPDAFSFVCGPPAMVSQAVMPALAAIGFDEDHVFEFD